MYTIPCISVRSISSSRSVIRPKQVPLQRFFTYSRLTMPRMKNSSVNAAQMMKPDQNLLSMGSVLRSGFFDGWVAVVLRPL